AVRPGERPGGRRVVGAGDRGAVRGGVLDRDGAGLAAAPLDGDRRVAGALADRRGRVVELEGARRLRHRLDGDRAGHADAARAAVDLAVVGDGPGAPEGAGEGPGAARGAVAALAVAAAGAAEAAVVGRHVMGQPARVRPRHRVARVNGEVLGREGEIA